MNHHRTCEEYGIYAPGQRIDACDGRPLVLIALRTGKGQVFGIARATVLLGDYVIDLEFPRMMFLSELAVFAAVFRAVADEVLKFALLDRSGCR